jgi:hypothetical protein
MAIASVLRTAERMKVAGTRGQQTVRGVTNLAVPETSPSHAGVLVVGRRQLQARVGATALKLKKTCVRVRTQYAAFACSI